MTSDDVAPVRPRSPFARIGRGGVRLIVWLAATLIMLVGAILLTVLGVGSMIPGGVLVLGVVGLIVFRRRVRWSFGAALAVCLGVVIWRGSLSPSNDRDWDPAVSVLPSVTVEGDVVTVEGVRNFAWRPDGAHDAAWETRSYRLTNLRGVDMILEPFIYSPLMAHTMLSFDFGEDGRLLLSIEARKEKNEPYNPVTGGLNQFELIYLFIDERDAFTVRASAGHELYAFPTHPRPLRHRAFFLSLCAAANNLHADPRFYHIIRHNCTTAWIQHADHLSAHPVGLSMDAVLNGRIARLLHARGVIDTDLAYDDAKAAFRIDQQVLAFADAPDFSARIRRGFPPRRGAPPPAAADAPSAPPVR